MAERNPSDDQAAFGVFPQLKRNRAKQDREAAKNVPIDLARGALAGVFGAPGDIESLVRMLPYLDEKTVLPTSEDIEKRIPLRSDTPVSKAATGLGILGGGFYTGPGSPLRVVGAIPAAVRHGAQEFAKASVAGAPNVVKREGGNWIQDTIDNSIRGLKSKVTTENFANYTPEQVEQMVGSDRVKRNDAINKWIESKIGRYVKSEMGTPSDPIRLLIEKREAEIADKFLKDQARANRMADRAAEEVDPRRKANLTRQAQRMLDDAVAQRDLAMEHTSHLPRGFQNVDANEFSDDVLKSVRKAEGFPEQGMGTTPSSRAWESKADMSIYPINVGEIQSHPANKLSRQKAIEEYNAYEDKLDQDVIKYLKSKGIEGQYMAGLMKMSGEEKAALVGDTKLKELLDAIPPYSNREPIYEMAGKESYINKLDPKSSVYSGDISGLHFDHIIDVLKEDVASGRITPEQLNKITMEQAVRRTADYDLERSLAMREAKIKQQEGFPVHKEYPDEGYKWIELTKPKITVDTPLPEGFRWLEPKGGYERLEGPSILDPQRTRTYLGETKEDALKVAEERSMLGSEQQKMLEDALKYEGDTMGHCVGGYCPDVLEGRTRIFSLRDTKGEPHVTIEVQPNRIAPKWDDVKPYLDAAREEAQKLPNGYTSTDIADIAMRMAKENMPDNIVQVKGKQNARPIEKYDPFTQDFVRSGNWNVIGDLKNTGLFRADPDELGMHLPTDINLYDVQGKRTDLFKRAKEAGLFPEGQKYLTRNEWEDILRKQYLAENPPKPDVPPEGMKRGGVAISKNPDTMMLAVNNQKLAGGGLTKLLKGAKEAAKAEPEIMKASEALGKIEGRPLVITQADRTKVGEGYLGGPGFSSLQLTEPEYRAAEAAWGVKTPGVAKMILGGGKKAGESPVYTTMIGSPTQHQSNQMVFDKLYGDFKKAAKKGGLPTELRDKINDRLVRAVDKEGNPVFPADIDILDKKFKDIANTFDRRSIAGHLMGGVQVGGKKGQIIDYDKIIRETTDPALLDVPSGALGNRLFTLSGGIIDRPDLHPAFPTILQGEDLGVNFSPVARDILMRDFIKKTMQEKGRAPGYMDYTRGHPPSQLITEDLLTEMQKLGLKKGGTVHKAAGGEITGDDLIIEERPL